MAISVTNLGSTATTAASSTLVFTGVTIPNAAVVAVLAQDNTLLGSSAVSVTDGSNSYTAIMQSTTGNKQTIFYAWNAAAVSAGSLTYSKSTSGLGGGFGSAALSAFYATGLQSSADPLDTAVSTKATGSSTTGTLSPTVTGGALSTNGELVVGAVTWAGSTSDTFTQASSYATPFEFNETAVGVEIAGGNRVSSASSAHTYAPTITTGAAGTVIWYDFIIAFKPSTAVVPSFGWYQGLTAPSDLRKRGLQPSQMPAYAGPVLVPPPSFGWFRPMSEPVRVPLRLNPGLQPAAFPSPLPLVSFGWMAPLSEPPVKAKPMLRVSAQQFLTMPVGSPIVLTPFNWFASLSEPSVKAKPGLHPSLQRFYTKQELWMTGGTITGRLDTQETRDAALLAGTLFSRPIEAKIGVIELAKVPYVGLIETRARPGVSGVVESHTAPVSGSPVTAIASAAVGIRII